MVISQPILTPIQQNYHHDHIFTYTFNESLSFSVQILGHVPPKAQDHKQNFSEDHE